MNNTSETVNNLRYIQFDPDHLTQSQQECHEWLVHRKSSNDLEDDDWITIVGFDNFAILAAMGWQRIYYKSHLIYTEQDESIMLWITDIHAEAIGKALRVGLKELHIDFTRLKGDGFTIMANAVPDSTIIQHLHLCHCSGDEVTARECRGIARLVNKLKCEHLHLSANEYDQDALDAMLDEFIVLNCNCLLEAEIIDSSKPEPNNQILHTGLIKLISPK